MLYRWSTRLAAVGAVCILSFIAACGSDKTTAPNNGTASIRIVNASSSTSALNATSGSTSLSSGLNFQNTNMTTTCATIPSGTQTITFTSGSSSTSIGSTTFNFQAGQHYTVVFYGSNSVAVYPETFTAPTSGNFAVRFINNTGSTGNIFVTAPGASIASSATPNVSALTTASVSGFNSASATGGTFVSFPTGSNFIRVFGTSANPNTATPMASFTINSMSTTGAQTVIFTPANSANGNATAFQVNSCS